MSLFKSRFQPKNIDSTLDAPAVLNLSKELSAEIKAVEYDFDQDDPFVQHLIKAAGPVTLEKLAITSPGLDYLKTEGVKIVVPLVSQGELIGMINLGSRMSEQDYSSDDYRLLNTLATQAAPALRVAQLAKQQEIQARERERIEQELRVARVIQETLLPKEIPQLDNWHLEALWQPAREVSGDFYDFFEFEDGRLGIIIADVTGKGVPAALVMATTRSILRAAAERLVLPGQVLERSNNLLCPDIPPNNFVTCLYVLLDPATGKLIYANAGHNLPQKCMPVGSAELRATGMPLGLLPGMGYEEKETVLEPGESVLLYSDGLVEAHNPAGDMFGFPRLRSIISEGTECHDQIQALMDELIKFTGPKWEQEDDVTFVSVHRLEVTQPILEEASPLTDQTILAEFSLPSQPGNERLAMEKVAQIALDAGFPENRVDKLKTAVAETALNAMEHGNEYDPDKPTTIRILSSRDRMTVLITDQGGSHPIPSEREVPDLGAKLAGLQSPRGWGLFLIQQMVDEINIHTNQEHHTVELVFNWEGVQSEGEKA